MATPFRMLIRDMFAFQDGRTVLVGPVEGMEEYLPAATCEIRVQGQIRATVRVEGEMIPYSGDHRQRAVSTRDTTGLDRALISQQECTLESIESPSHHANLLQAEHGRV
jgi:hypothetical protein